MTRIHQIQQSATVLSSGDDRLGEELQRDLHQIEKNAGLLDERINQALAENPPVTNKLLHDLRSPLNLIVGFTEMLLDDETSTFSREQHLHLRRIHDGALRVADFIGERFG